MCNLGKMQHLTEHHGPCCLAGSWHFGWWNLNTLKEEKDIYHNFLHGPKAVWICNRYPHRILNVDVRSQEVGCSFGVLFVQTSFFQISRYERVHHLCSIPLFVPQESRSGGCFTSGYHAGGHLGDNLGCQASQTEVFKRPVRMEVQGFWLSFSEIRKKSSFLVNFILSRYHEIVSRYHEIDLMVTS